MKLIEISANEYADFLDKLEDKNIFAQLSWLKPGSEHRIKYFGLFKNEGIEAVFATEELKMGPFSVLVNPYFTPHCGPWTDKISEELISESLKLFEDSYHELQFRPELEYKSDFSSSAKAKKTFILELKHSEEELWEKLRSDKKRQIRKVQKLDHQVRKASKEELLRFFEMTAARNKYELDLKRLKLKLSGAERSYTPLLEINGEALGSILILSEGKRAFYLGGGFDDKSEYSSIVNSYLLWDAILWSKKEGVEIFDFEGSEIPGIAEFYRRFGAEELDYFASSKLPKGFKKLQWLKKQILP